MSAVACRDHVFPSPHLPGSIVEAGEPRFESASRYRLGRRAPSPYPADLVSTRRLILLALACGLAILVAGSIQLLRISRNEPTVEVGRIGTSATIDGVAVTLVGQPESDRVVVRVAVADDRAALDDVAAPWAVRVGAERFSPVQQGLADGPPGCDEVGPIAPGAAAECQLGFDTSEAGAGTRYLQFTLQGATAVWSLDE